VGEVSVTLLSGFAASVDGEPVPDAAWRLKKARELVKLLALAPGHRVHREQAMDVLWRDRPPEAAANNLHQAVYVARRALDPDAIAVREEMLELTADIDVDRLELAAADARRMGTPAAYRAALSIYAGELLPENRYDDWTTDRRDALAELAAELEETLAGIAPLPDDEAPARPLPLDTSSFIGRDRELIELKALLGSTRLLTLAGTGGIGKTRLALELAREAGDGYADGAALVELAAVSDPHLVIDALALALDVRALSGQPLVDAVVEFVATESLLLVLDNCEHLLAEAARLAETLLRSSPELRIIATSREPLRIPGEVVFRVPSLGIPDPERAMRPSDLLRHSAVRLFVERAAAAAPDFLLDEDNAADIARICFRLDGLPLALELAAGRLGALGPAAIAERLDDRFRVLRNHSLAAPTRQLTLAATLEWSHDLLDPDERTLLRRLGIFAGGFELDAVEAVCGEDIESAGVADLLARLVEKSLVAADEGSSRQRRYRLLETVRLYARQQLEAAGEVPALAARHGTWALALAEAEGDSPRLDVEAPNLRAALDTLGREAPEDALRLCVQLGPFWLRRIDLHEARRRFEQALEAAPQHTRLRAHALLAAAAIDFRSGTVPRALTYSQESLAVAVELGHAQAEWRALQFLGEIALTNDATDAAIGWFERARALAQRRGLAAAEALGVYSIGVARWMVGDAAGAETELTRSRKLFDAAAASSERIPTPVNIGDLRSGLADDRPGLPLVFEETLQPFLEITSETAVAYVLANLAGALRSQGRLDEARTLLDESAARFEATGDVRGAATVLVRRAYLALAAGDVTAAREWMHEALDLRREHDDRRGVGLALSGLGRVETAAGEYAAAERHLTEALNLFRRAGDRWGVASTQWRAADLAFARGRTADAEAALLEARAVLDVTGRDRWIANTLIGLAQVALLHGDRERAADLLTEARVRFAACQDAPGAADAERRLEAVAKGPLSDGKAPPRTNVRTPNRKETGHEPDHHSHAR
jgi:predicted ATPase